MDALIQEGAAESDSGARNAIYQQLGRMLQEEPAAIYLWNAVTRYGVEPELADWEPRGDDYIVLTKA